ncbi:MAG: class II aldolase/adducin family protein [Chloroflexi bacterium]|nr:class II aldolase/adducin family protein [Chloroflexota bacterium]
MGYSFLPEFQSVGAELRHDRLVTACGGNLSMRLGNRMLITRHGCSLGRLTNNELVETGYEPEDSADIRASMELPVHRAIYHHTTALAIVHAHAPHAIAVSMKAQDIRPLDVEGSVLLGIVPVLGQREEIGPGHGAEHIARALQDKHVVMVRAHGCFAVGRDLEEAHGYVSTLEESCRILCLLRSMGQ